jgi:hypothetical protein
MLYDEENGLFVGQSTSIYLGQCFELEDSLDWSLETSKNLNMHDEM